MKKEARGILNRLGRKIKANSFLQQKSFQRTEHTSAELSPKRRGLATPCLSFQELLEVPSPGFRMHFMDSPNLWIDRPVFTTIFPTHISWDQFCPSRNRVLLLTTGVVHLRKLYRKDIRLYFSKIDVNVTLSYCAEVWFEVRYQSVWRLVGSKSSGYWFPIERARLSFKWDRSWESWYWLCLSGFALFLAVSCLDFPGLHPGCWTW